MREIKFRGYAVEKMVGSQWLYGFGVMDIDYVDGTVEYHLHTLNGVYEVVPESVGQITGLKDKNGKEIYEGDIVEYSDYSGALYLGREQPKARGVIKWDKKKTGYHLQGMGMYIKQEKTEVIGNIYEHSHLLDK